MRVPPSTVGELIARPRQRQHAADGRERIDVTQPTEPVKILRVRAPYRVTTEDIIFADTGTARIYLPSDREKTITIKALTGVYVIAEDAKIDGQAQLLVSAGKAVTLVRFEKNWFAIGGY